MKKRFKTTSFLSAINLVQNICLYHDFQKFECVYYKFAANFVLCEQLTIKIAYIRTKFYHAILPSE